MQVRRALVRKVDHFYIPYENAETVFSFLTQVLALPVAWPYKDYGSISSGGVGLGNVNLEILRSSTLVDSFVAHRPARIQGIAFEPEPVDEEFLADLDSRGIVHSPPSPFECTLGSFTGLLFTTVFFADFISESAAAFVCQYHLPEITNQGARRAALDAVGGGVLGIESCKEFIIGSPDTEAAASRWQRLFDPIKPRQFGEWQIGEGPTILSQAERILGSNRLAVLLASEVGGPGGRRNHRRKDG